MAYNFEPVVFPLYSLFSRVDFLGNRQTIRDTEKLQKSTISQIAELRALQISSKLNFLRLDPSLIFAMRMLNPQLSLHNMVSRNIYLIMMNQISTTQGVKRNRQRSPYNTRQSLTSDRSSSCAGYSNSTKHRLPTPIASFLLNIPVSRKKKLQYFHIFYYHPFTFLIKCIHIHPVVELTLNQQPRQI